jgi:hypothetical protein
LKRLNNTTPNFWRVDYTNWAAAASRIVLLAYRGIPPSCLPQA